ncbi:DUF3244 domain-containing protein [uncultured Bacteroides sp.]|uniref:DUF3244 domain-containing protein n=1 Tax=uncultured Bacteroides sp. TaxID=162156 RepID=UPI0026364238|nr:DUF3244 domain-containing protein [uncultured Bacteroides sp.]
MKSIILFTLGLLVYINCWADNTNIPLQKTKDDNHAEKVIDNRSISHYINAFHDRNQIYIYSDKEIEYIDICVYDLHGNILFEQEMSNLIGSYSFQLNASTNELLILMITTTTDSYRGEFYLNE